MAKVRRALLSVSDKTGLVEFATRLADMSVELLASGGTAKKLREAGLTVIGVSEYTKAPEILGGRVKTLHPRIHGGILARRGLSGDEADLEAQNILPIDLVAVNLYPFEAAAAQGVDDDALIEKIDIGGPTLIRASAKNWKHVAVVCDPTDYDKLCDELKESGELSDSTRSALSLKAFERTAAYDQAIVTELCQRRQNSAAESDGAGASSSLPARRVAVLSKVKDLRYGENPHQAAALYALSGERRGLAGAEILGGKALSYNNLMDADGAWRFVHECQSPTACVVKHASPCGAFQHDDPATAVAGAYAGDPLSAFGGIIAYNSTLNLEAAEFITAKGRFVEVVIAADFTEEALAKLRKKKKMRILKISKPNPVKKGLITRLIDGGVLVQENDAPEAEAFNIVSKAQPDEVMKAQMAFAIHCVKHVRSNAIVLVKDGALVGVGGGQPSRVDAVLIACRKAGERAEGAILASDAFFPFPDGVETAAESGIKFVIQPGGSIRDQAVTEAADKLGLVMVHTGKRHFLH
jgi:phosphoribosylaminoimidazolecarboxamide formyltransferase / IMP cyclohydrolase